MYNNIEYDLKIILGDTSYGWFEGKIGQFTNHPLYDKKGNSLKYVIIKEPIAYSREELEFLKKDNIVVSTKPEKVPVQKSFREFCWDSSTTPEHTKDFSYSNIFPFYIDDYKGILQECLARLEQTLLLTGSIQEKYNILSKCNQVVSAYIIVIKLRTNNEIFNSVLDLFLQTYTWQVTTKYGNVFWYYDNFVDKKSPQAPRSKMLKEEDFGDILNLYDEDEPIIPDEEMRNKNAYRKYFFEIYTGVKPKSKITINFECEKNPIYYIVTNIIRTQKRLTLKKICALGFIKIKGKQLVEASCRKGAYVYENKPVNSALRFAIDKIFER